MIATQQAHTAGLIVWWLFFKQVYSSTYLYYDEDHVESWDEDGICMGENKSENTMVNCMLN